MDKNTIDNTVEDLEIPEGVMSLEELDEMIAAEAREKNGKQ